jgi:hypothetical protein
MKANGMGWGTVCFFWAIMACSLSAAGPKLTPEDAYKVSRVAIEEAIDSAISGNSAIWREKLSQAIALDPQGELPQWHLGKVQLADRWVSVDEYEAAWANDPRSQQFELRRGRLDGDVMGEMKLAAWCEGKSHLSDDSIGQVLADLAKFHYVQVLRNSSAGKAHQERALTALGLQLYDGQWRSPQEIATRKLESAELKRATDQWERRVRRWANALANPSDREQTFVRQDMQELTNPAAIPLLEQQMSTASEAASLAVVEWLGGRPEFKATVSLITHATQASWMPVRQAAIERLKDRPIHDVVPQLLGDLMSPVESKFAIRVSPFGSVIHQHEFYRSGRDVNEVAQAAYVDHVQRVSVFGNFLRSNSRPLRVRISRNATSAQEVADQNQRMKIANQLLTVRAVARGAQMEQQVAQLNDLVRQNNDPLFHVLGSVADVPLPEEPEAWWDWWSQYNEQYSPPKETQYWYDYDTEDHDLGISTHIYVTNMSCFVEGTPVRTDTGLMPIENVLPGQRVLSQEIETGKLAYKVVDVRTERPASEILCIELEGDRLLTTKGHPFWVNGAGWRMAKRLKLGDVLHTLSGPRRVTEISTKEAQPAYNLVIQDGNSYFVGEIGALVHDNKPRQPTLAVVPGWAKN